MAEITARIEDASHAFAPDGADFVSEVPELRMHARFDDAGAHIRPGNGAAVTLRTAVVGRDAWPDRRSPSEEPLAGAPALGDDQPDLTDPEGRHIPRLEYASENLVEWWSSRRGGFEQGWEIASRPDGRGALTIGVAVDGADARVRPDGVELDNDDGDTLLVHALMATDAAGEPLPARFEADPDGFRIVVDDEGAAYPIAIDPIYTTTAWSAEGTAGFDSGLGNRVSGAGDVNGDGYDDALVTGAGCVYVFEGSASGLPTTATATISAPADAGTSFGAALSRAGDVNADGYDDVVIGAYDSGTSDTGAAYVFEGSSTGLSTTPATTLTGADRGNYFGYAVAGAGDVNGDGYDDVIVSAPEYLGYTGRVYVYEGSATGVPTTETTTLTGAATFYYFGKAVAIAGDVNGDGYDDVVIGADGYSSGTGRTYVYQGGASGVAATATTTITGSHSGGYFGGSVAGAGDTNGDGYDDIVVGSTGTSGAFNVYRGSRTGITTTSVFSFGGSYGDQLGNSVASGDFDGDGLSDVVIGAPGYSSYAGKVYVASGGLAHTTTLTGSGTARDYFGYSVASLGDVDGDGSDELIVSANGWSDIGAAYVYDLTGTPLYVTHTTIIGASDDELGISVAGAGDVNGDGYDDVIVGAYGYLGYTGRALIYEGSASGLATTASVTFTGSAVEDYFGKSVAGAGDVNGDGYDDVVVGAYGHGTYGTAYVYDGSRTGPSTTPTTTIDGLSTSYYLGNLVAGAGDVNGDGYDDVLIATTGAYPYKINVYQGSATGTRTTATTSIQESTVVTAIASAGDVNGDGYDDIVVGCSGYSSSKGQAYLYDGSAGGVSSTAASTLTGETTSSYLGQAVAGAGDVNGDGYDDVVVGAYGYSSSKGRVYVYHGSSSGLGTSATTTVTGDTAADRLGYAVSGAGDMNADGYDDVVVGATGYGGTGALFVYPGSASGLDGTAADTITGSGALGYAVASAGDVNGDGIPDIIASDVAQDSDAGAVYVFEGDVDADGDGYPASMDCDDGDATITGPYTAWADTDGDGYGDPAAATEICAATAGYVDDATDCDDNSATSHPGGTEVCDAADSDEDCDGAADDADLGATGKSIFYADADGDGYGDPGVTVEACDAPAGYVSDSADCDEGAASVNPGAAEVCDGASTDEDCDGLADDADTAADGKTTWYRDDDGDGYGATTADFCHAPASGYVATPGDCDDASAAISPRGTEVCDGSDADEDCDGLADDADGSATGQSTFYLDSDHDGYGGAVTGAFCDAPPGWVATSADCDDGAAAIHPGATETCDASDTDEDCDGAADDADPDATGKTTSFLDADGDGYAGATTTAWCDTPAGYYATSTDCDDTSDTIHPGATEVCDPADADEDCDGLADDADSSATGETTFHVDADGDGYGSAATTSRCDAAAGAVTDATDCDDTNAAVSPGASETAADGIDEDCDGAETCYADADGDGYRGTATVESADADCADAGEALSAAAPDCDDGDAATAGGSTEIVGDGIDEDCDGAELCWDDADGDGYRSDDAETIASDDLDCEGPTEVPADAPAGDCDDHDPAYHPGAEEANCADPNDYNCDGSVGRVDGDGDGYAACEDCDDARTDVSPGETEVCDGRDDDCDGTIDVGASDATLWYADADGDGYGAAADPVSACEAPDGYVAITTPDCDDTDDTVHPEAVDTPDDGIDQDCDGADTTSVDTASGDTGSGPGDDKSCGCAAEPGGGPPWTLAGIAGLALLIRRRRDPRRR
jgi:MYXO-CTERM domain-containing protein